MKTTFIIASLLSVLPGTAANFDIYMVEASTTASGYGHRYWQVFEAEPNNCGEVFGAPLWSNKRDVSGTKTGVRCKGSGCGYWPPPGDIDVLEMNFHGTGPVYHWTLYKDRGWTMVGLDGKTYGRCIVLPAGDYECTSSHSNVYRNGFRKFRCLTSFTADQLNAAA